MNCRHARKGVFIGLLVGLLICSTLSSIVRAVDSYDNVLEITVTDTSGSAREYVSIITGVTGSNLNGSGYIASDGMDTRLQETTTSLNYLMGTTHIPVVMPSLGADQTRTIDLYMGYDPLQTTLPMTFGGGGYVTTTDAAAIELDDDFIVEIDGYIDTSSGAGKNLLNKASALVVTVSAAEEITATINATALVATGIASGDHNIKVVCDEGNAYLLVDDVIYDASGGGLIGTEQDEFNTAEISYDNTLANIVSDGTYLYVSSYDGYISKYDVATLTLQDYYEVAVHSVDWQIWDMTLLGGFLYFPHDNTNLKVTKVDISTMTASGTFTASEDGDGEVITNDGTYIYASDGQYGRTYKLNTALAQQGSTLDLAGGTEGLAVIGSYLYVSTTANVLYKVDTSTMTTSDSTTKDEGYMVTDGTFVYIDDDLNDVIAKVNTSLTTVDTYTIVDAPQLSVMDVSGGFLYSIYSTSGWASLGTVKVDTSTMAESDGWYGVYDDYWDYDPQDAVVVGANLYVLLKDDVPKVIEVAVSTMVPTGNEAILKPESNSSYGAGDIFVDANYLYVTGISDGSYILRSDRTTTDVVDFWYPPDSGYFYSTNYWLSENGLTSLESDGTYLYSYWWSGTGNGSGIYKITKSNLSTAGLVEFAPSEDFAVAKMVYDGGYLYAYGYDETNEHPLIKKVDVSTMTEVDSWEDASEASEDTGWGFAVDEDGEYMYAIYTDYTDDEITIYKLDTATLTATTLATHTYTSLITGATDILYMDLHCVYGALYLTADVWDATTEYTYVAAIDPADGSIAFETEALTTMYLSRSEPTPAGLLVSDPYGDYVPANSALYLLDYSDLSILDTEVVGWDLDYWNNYLYYYDTDDTIFVANWDEADYSLYEVSEYAITNDTEAVPDNANNIIFDQNDVMPYIDWVYFDIAGTQTLQYEPAAMVVGTALPDRATGDGTQNGVITWGSNTSLTVSVGGIDPADEEDVISDLADEDAVSDVVNPADQPNNWFGGTDDISNLPFYTSISGAAAGMGMPTMSLWVMLMLGVAVAVGLGVLVFTGSTLLAASACAMAIAAGVNTGVLSVWMLFVYIVMGIAIVYLARQN